MRKRRDILLSLDPTGTGERDTFHLCHMYRVSTRTRLMRGERIRSPVPGSGPVIIVYPCAWRMDYSAKNSVTTPLLAYVGDKHGNRYL